MFRSRTLNFAQWQFNRSISQSPTKLFSICCEQGKGTLSTRLVERYEVEPISTGDLLRAEVRAQTELGREVEAIMARGGIVNDQLVLRLVSNKLNDLRDRGVHVSAVLFSTCDATSLEFLGYS